MMLLNRLSKPADLAVLQGKRILLVEDEVLISNIVVEILREYGVTVVGPAATLAQALALIESDQPEAAILDVNLGSETSFPAAQALRDREVPYLFTTAFVGREHPDILGKPFLPKPYGIKQLLQALSELLDETH